MRDVDGGNVKAKQRAKGSSSSNLECAFCICIFGLRLKWLFVDYF